MFAYSALGRDHVGLETLDARRSIDAIARELGLDDGRLTVTGERPVFRTQAVRFEQVMRNLLDNAVRHHEDDPATLRVTLRIDAAPDGWCFEVADNGPGIPPRFHDTVFELFRRLRPKDDVEGSGVGLSIVRRSLEAVGGSVSLRSLPGEGCTFELFWPLDETVPADPMAAREVAGVGGRRRSRRPDGARGMSAMRILHVDDNEIDAELVRRDRQRAWTPGFGWSTPATARSRWRGSSAPGSTARCRISCCWT